MEFFENKSCSNRPITISNFLRNISQEETIKAILDGLTLEHRYISSKYFYDETGSKLFEEITFLPEYYLTRTEIDILRDVSSQIAETLKHADIVEIGSGDSSKITILLEAIPVENLESVCYMPVDVNRTVIEDSAKILFRNFPGLKIHGVVADFAKQLDLIPRGGKRLICFFGSTVGNLAREDAITFFSDLGTIMQSGDMLLLGADMVKSRDALEKAYNDSEKITARFNLNILNVINRLVGTDFDPEAFSHMAFYDEAHARVEMHLKAVQYMEISSPHLRDKIIIKEGETIHTESSHKFTEKHIESLASAAGLDIKNIFTDRNKWFSLIQFLKAE